MHAMPAFACTACHSASAHDERVRSAFWQHERLLVVDGVPALVCDGCGERYYDDATSTRLDLMRGSGFPDQRARATLQVPVFSFDDLVPG